MYFVYRVEINNVTRYVGYTGDIIKREKQHNYLCFKALKKKILYNEIRKTEVGKIELKMIRAFRTKLEAKRYEAFLILNDYFSKKCLWQRVPRISDM